MTNWQKTIKKFLNSERITGNKEFKKMKRNFYYISLWDVDEYTEMEDGSEILTNRPNSEKANDLRKTIKEKTPGWKETQVNDYTNLALIKSKYLGMTYLNDFIQIENNMEIVNILKKMRKNHITLPSPDYALKFFINDKSDENEKYVNLWFPRDFNYVVNLYDLVPDLKIDVGNIIEIDAKDYSPEKEKTLLENNDNQNIKRTIRGTFDGGELYWSKDNHADKDWVHRGIDIGDIILETKFTIQKYTPVFDQILKKLDINLKKLE